MYSKESGMIIFDAPQLFESGGNEMCDKIIAVIAPADVRVQRIISRDGISEQEALLRIHAQHDENFYISKSDYIIDGSQTLESVQKQFEEIMKKVMEE